MGAQGGSKMHLSSVCALRPRMGNTSTWCCPQEKSSGIVEVHSLPPFSGEGDELVTSNALAPAGDVEEPAVSSTVARPVRGARPVQGAAVELHFEAPDGKTTVARCTTRPLGMKFGKTSPLAIIEIKTGSLAQELGVREGWKLIGISDLDCRGADGAHVYKTLCDNIAVLPIAH